MSDQVKNLSTNARGGGMNGTWLTIKEAQNLITSSENGYHIFISKLTVNMIKTENVVYKSCPVDGCNKKVRRSLS